MINTDSAQKAPEGDLSADEASADAGSQPWVQRLRTAQNRTMILLAPVCGAPPRRGQGGQAQGSIAGLSADR
jgi:hypothetical protein